MSDLLTKRLIPALAIADRDDRHGKLMDLWSMGLIPEIAGGAGGFNQAGDVITKTADGRDLNQVWSDFQAALQLYNANRDRLLGIMTFPVTQPIEDVFQGGDTVNFEEASEYGVPRGVRAAVPTYFSLGYGFKWWDIGLRFTWKFLAEAEATQVDSLNNQILEADNRNVFQEIMKAVLNNNTRSARISGNNYNVFPLYNGDSTVPPVYKNTVLTAPHSHYLVSGAATVESADFQDMEDHLKHHGYTWQNGTALVALVNSAQLPTIRTFRVDTGSTYDFIQSQATPDWALSPADIIAMTGQRVSAAPPSSWNGMTVAGRYGPWLIVEEDLIPAGNMLGLASGGTEDARNVVGLREHRNSGLRGLRLVKGPDADYPLIDSYYQRGFGTGVRQRGAAVVMQIKASGSYVIPTGFTY